MPERIVFEDQERDYVSTTLRLALDSVVTAYRYAIESGDIDMENEIEEYAIEVAGLSYREGKIAYKIARQEEENHGEDI